MSLALPAAAAARTPRTPIPAPNPIVVAGPSAAISSLGGMAIARDGTGGLVYVQGGHVFLSRLVNGSFQAPQQLDAGLTGTSSQPVVAASNGGLLTLAFINSGVLYVSEATGASVPPSAPAPLFVGATSPALSMSNYGKAYLAFTSVGSGGDDVRCAYYYQGQWALEQPPLDASPGDNAGSGSGRPAVVAANDGIGVVAWGEAGHVYTRRVWGTQPDPTFMQADPSSLGGYSEVGAGAPAVSSAGNSSYFAVAFQETFSSGSATQTRVLMNHTQAEQYDGATPADGIPAMGGESADQPQIALTEYGRGWVTSQNTTTHALTGTLVTTNAWPQATEQINGQAGSAAPAAVPATAGIVSTLIVWEQSPGAAGPADIRLRYAADGSDLGPEQVISVPAQGAANASAGLAAGGDLAGDAAAAWVQGSGAQTEIVTDQLYQPPGGFSATNAFRYVRTTTPLLTWNPASELWGPLTYAVHLDGTLIGETGATLARTPPLSQGPHGYQVTAINQGGASTNSAPAIVFVDTFPPTIQSLRLRGRRTVGATIRLSVRDTDVPPGVPRADTSGVKSVQVRWGDGRRAYVHFGRARHAYRRRGRFTITVIVTDRAGNRTIVKRRLVIRGSGHGQAHSRRRRG